MKRFNASKVRALGNLQSKTDKQKARIRTANGIRVRWSQDREQPVIKKTRDFLAPTDPSFVPRKPLGRRGAFLSHEKRLAILARHEAREAFFASL